MGLPEVGLNGAHGSIGENSAVGQIIAGYLDQMTPEQAVEYLQTVTASLASTLASFVGKPIAQLPTTANVPIKAPLPKTGLADPAADALALLGAAVQDFVPSLLGGLAPLLIGIVVLVAVIGLIYLGIKRTIL